MSLKIYKRNGELDIEVPNGEYYVEGKITIGDKGIKYIDNCTWKRMVAKSES